MATQIIDDPKVAAFAQRMTDTVNEALLAGMIGIGHQTSRNSAQSTRGRTHLSDYFTGLVGASSEHRRGRADTGGLISNPDIIAHEYRVPTGVSSGIGTSALRDGRRKTVDGSNRSADV